MGVAALATVTDPGRPIRAKKPERAALLEFVKTKIEGDKIVSLFEPGKPNEAVPVQSKAQKIRGGLLALLAAALAFVILVYLMGAMD